VEFFQTKPLGFKARSFQGTMLGTALLLSSTNMRNRVHSSNVLLTLLLGATASFTQLTLRCLQQLPTEWNSNLWYYWQKTNPDHPFLNSYKVSRGITTPKKCSSFDFWM